MLLDEIQWKHNTEDFYVIYWNFFEEWKKQEIWETGDKRTTKIGIKKSLKRKQK